MTDQNKFLMVFVIDNSGSMESIEDEMNGALKRVLESQRSLPGEMLVSHFGFSNFVKQTLDMVPLKDVTEIAVRPHAATALYDGIGTAISFTGRKLASMSEEERPGRVLVFIVTDGRENASREYTKDRVFEMIRHQTEKYGWVFSYLGANQDAMAEGMKLGMSAGAAYTYEATSAGVKAAGLAAANYTTQVRNTGQATYDNTTP